MSEDYGRESTLPESRRQPTFQRIGRGADVLLVVATATATALIVAMVIVVVSYLIAQGYQAMRLDFLVAPPSAGVEFGGVGPAIVGTAALTLLMTVVVLPFGVLTAVYTSEYANPDSWLVRVVRVAVANLAAVPSVVFGLFGLGFFVQTLGHAMDEAAYRGTVTYGRPTLLWAALTLALLTLPVVIVATEDALRAVPRELRQASLALGATRFRTTFFIVLPQALGGILTGAILAISRGAGEVAPLLFIQAAYFLPAIPRHLSDPFMHLGYHVYVLATQSPDVDRTRPQLFGTVLVLFLLTFLLNALAIVIRARTTRMRSADS